MCKLQHHAFSQTHFTGQIQAVDVQEAASKTGQTGRLKADTQPCALTHQPAELLAYLEETFKTEPKAKHLGQNPLKTRTSQREGNIHE